MNIKMRKSRVLTKLRNNEIALSTKINLTDPVSVELAALAGFDCVWLDMEHIPCDWDAICNMIRTAKIYDMDAMVRVSKGSYSDLIKPLEADATGIIYPHLMNYEEAKKLVYFTKFYPVGRRPIDGGNADAMYCQIDIKSYIKQANSERFVMVQIEDPEVVADLERIVQLEGIDIIFSVQEIFLRVLVLQVILTILNLLQRGKKLLRYAKSMENPVQRHVESINLKNTRVWGIIL